MKGQHGNRYTSLAASPAPKVVIEERGPLRVCVLITGHLFSAQGVRFCPYRLRLHLYAGKPESATQITAVSASRVLYIPRKLMSALMAENTR